ncbi:MAG: CCA tRNA nucleotidyltransferase [Clostridia bacterium]|jgi:tRNA nucleotidyltransferase (CCA-adding enzyme)|nr:CCA tRNA nucleotidyltransferase [Clostridia bacterium]MBT7123040.1 CCA tRNA nucleotidyltransferase [Clostridia bacterium]
MSEIVSKGAIALSKIFNDNGHTLYLVGGSVRNMICGLPGGDADVCSTALPGDAAAFLRGEKVTVIEKALALGTIEAHLTLDGEKYVFEHTTFRQDYYHDGGVHRPYKVHFTKDIAIDARRRDFTVNALYLDLQTDEIIDPTGRGIADAHDGIIRAAADNAIDTLKDDGLRIMRMVRFAAELGFSVSEDLHECAKQNACMLADISVERKRDELFKIMLADTKYGKDGAQLTGLLLLRELGAMQYVLPVLNEGDGVQQSKRYHAHDVMGHGISACAQAAPILPLRLAALLHDIGKPRAMEAAGNMYDHDEIGTQMARQALSKLKIDNKTKKTVVTLVAHHMFDLTAKAKPKTIRKHAIGLGRETFELLIALRRADFLGSGMGEAVVTSADNWQNELDVMINKKVPWSVADLNVTGSEIMEALGIAPSRKIGDILMILFKECVRNPGKNTKEILIKRAKKLI